MTKKDVIEAYKAMAKENPSATMEAQIRANLEATCDKYRGNEDKFERSIKYLNDCAREILENRNGDVPDEVCYRICRDYFNDEIWKQEDEEEAKRKDESNAARKKINAKKKKCASKDAKKAEPKANAEKKAPAEPEKKETCTVCRKEFKKLYVNGLCRKCHEEKRRKEAEAVEIKRAQQEIIAENNKKLGIGMAQAIDMFAGAV